MDIERDGAKISIAVDKLTMEEHSKLFTEVVDDPRSKKLLSRMGDVGLGISTEQRLHPGLFPGKEHIEMIEAQLDNSYCAYSGIIEQLNAGRKRSERIVPVSSEQMAVELSTWMTDDKLAYIDGTMELDSELGYTLVATPNVPVTTDGIIKFTTTFGETQPYSTSVYEPLYHKYKAEQLSGYDPNRDTDVRFKLIPSKFTPDFYSTAGQQVEKLARAQITNPFLSVPSVLDALVFWETLRNDSHGALIEPITFDRTYIRHFDLESKQVGRLLLVPESCVDHGQPYLDFSGVVRDRNARVAVG